MATIVSSEVEDKVIKELKRKRECKQEDIVAALPGIDKDLLLSTIAMMIDFGKVSVTLKWKLKLPAR